MDLGTLSCHLYLLGGDKIPRCDVCGKEWSIEDARQGKFGGRVEGVLLCNECLKKLTEIELEFVNKCLGQLIRARLGLTAEMIDVDEHMKKHSEFLQKLVGKGIPAQVLKYRMLSRVLRQSTR